jgi:ParB family chromosome partitioning protein
VTRKRPESEPAAPETPLSSPGQVVNVAVAAVVVGDRFRKDLGDMQPLMASMADLGLLQPIGVSRDNRLIFGARRLEAARRLGWPTIPCRAFDLDAPGLLIAERDENDCRKEPTPTEKAALARAIAARIGDRQGQRTDTLPAPGQEVEGPAPGQETLDFAARKAGLGSGNTLRRVEKVEAEGTPELVAAMDSGAVPVKAAATIAALPAEQQRQEMQQRQDRAAGRREPGRKKPRAEEDAPAPPAPPEEAEPAPEAVPAIPDPSVPTPGKASLIGHGIDAVKRLVNMRAWPPWDPDRRTRLPCRSSRPGAATPSTWAMSMIECSSPGSII